ncbi:MAG: glycoside hydrolase family 43 protein [Deltaproteobacteria bacterium]|nr:glycoside hydrolase family 43 protein [Deltaproteobacteria bacterium]
MSITNPILPGFHPDPSILRVGDDYYIANSTFCWHPAVRIHHSRDLKNWKLRGYAVTRDSQLDLRGNEDHGGIWAPCLSHHDGLFYLIYTDVKNWTSPAYKDAHNYLITAPTIDGPWSDPIYLNSSGFDPSLFHDDDGRTWLVNMLWDHRMNAHPFGGILLQEYDRTRQKLVGPVNNIFHGTDIKMVEGPHLYKKDGYYYLLTAEGGTTWWHAASLARSKSIDGPYDIMPKNPLITSATDDTLALQRAGHGSFVETQDGQWYFAHLCGRPVMPMRKCILGRETALQALDWPKGEWPTLAHGTNTPALETRASGLPEVTFERDAKHPYFNDDFESDKLDLEYNSLRVPIDDSWASLAARPGFLRIWGRESLNSRHRQSLIARRIVHFDTSAACAVDFQPETFQHMAGLIFYYDTTNHHYLYITCNNDGQRVLGIITADGGQHIEYPNAVVALPDTGTVYLKGVMHGATLQFYYATSPQKWIAIGRPLDATILADEHKAEVKFTGAYAGICVQNLSGQSIHGDFDWFNMEKAKDAGTK